MVIPEQVGQGPTLLQGQALGDHGCESLPVAEARDTVVDPPLGGEFQQHDGGRWWGVAYQS